jgi:hypothetical protein
MKLGVALVATMSALVLSSLIASAKTAFDIRSNRMVQASADIVPLDRDNRARPLVGMVASGLWRAAARGVSPTRPVNSGLVPPARTDDDDPKIASLPLHTSGQRQIRADHLFVDARIAHRHPVNLNEKFRC